MTSTCEDIELNNSEMDSFSIQNVRRDSSHCFYQNRGMIQDNFMQNKFKNNQMIQFSYSTVIQPLLTGNF